MAFIIKPSGVPGWDKDRFLRPKTLSCLIVCLFPPTAIISVHLLKRNEKKNFSDNP